MIFGGQFTLLILKFFLLPIFLSFSIVLLVSFSSASNYQKVTFETEDVARIEGSFFDSKKPQAVVFAHGAVFNKESWYLLAEGLQKEGIASLAIDFRGYGNSLPGKSKSLYYDVLGAVNYLEEKGFKHIALVGGSMGGRAILHALEHNVNQTINKVILLAPAGGEAIKNKKIRKLFIVTKDDRFYSRVYALFTESSEPKEFKVYPGTAHAQHMLKTESGQEIETLIINFLRE